MTEKSNKQTTARLPRFVRRTELRRIIPLADTTIYDMECKGQFPRRFSLTPRCVVWDLDEVEAWLRERRQASAQGLIKRPPQPDSAQQILPVAGIPRQEDGSVSDAANSSHWASLPEQDI